MAGARFATFWFVLVLIWWHQWVELITLSSHHSHEWRWEGKRRNLMWKDIGVTITGWSRWTWICILFLDATVALWSTSIFTIFVYSGGFLSSLLFSFGSFSFILDFDDLKIFGFSSLQLLIPDLLFVHLDYVVGNIIDIISPISILFLAEWSNWIHKMFLHWCDVSLIDWLWFHAFLWCLEVIILCLTCDVELTNLVTRLFLYLFDRCEITILLINLNLIFRKFIFLVFWR